MRKLHTFRICKSSELCKFGQSLMLPWALSYGMACDMEKKDVRIQLVISQSEIDALDEWRAANKIWSRSDAIRRLIADGLKVAKDKPKK